MSPDSKRGGESPYKVIHTPLESLRHRGYQVCAAQSHTHMKIAFERL